MLMYRVLFYLEIEAENGYSRVGGESYMLTWRYIPCLLKRVHFSGHFFATELHRVGDTDPEDSK